MKTQITYILRRVAVALVLACIFGLVRKASALTITATSPPTGQINQEFPGFTVRIHNGTGPAVTLYPSNNGSTVYFPTVSANNPTLQLLNNAPASFVVPAGGYYDLPVTVKFYKNNSTSGSWTIGETAISDFRLRNAAFAYFYPTISVAPTLTASGSWGLTSTPGRLGNLYISNPAPSGRVTVIADTAAAGPPATRSWSIGSPGSIIPTILVNGSNVVLDTNTPANYSGTVNVYQNGLVIGSAPVVKDSFGNFDLTVNAVGLLVTAKTTVTTPGYVSGEFKMVYQGWEAYPHIFALGLSSVFEHIVQDPYSYANNLSIKVYQKSVPPGETDFVYKLVGSSTLIKDAVGGWNITIPLLGSGDPAGTGNTATFSLDAMIYDAGEKTVMLNINGTNHIATPSAMVGDPATGTRRVYTVTLDNADGSLSGKAYRWTVTGTHENGAVNGLTIAGGSTPYASPVGIAGDLDEVRQGFVVADVATVGTPESVYNPPTTPPEIAFDPEAPIDPEDPRAEQKQQQKENYEAQRAALQAESMLDDPIQAPDTREAEDLAKRMMETEKAMNDSFSGLSDALTLPDISTGEYGSSPTLTITLPVFGSFTIDSSGYGGVIQNVRGILLAFIGFASTVSATKIVSATFV